MIMCRQRFLVLIVLQCIQSGAFLLSTFPASFVRNWDQSESVQSIYSPSGNLDPSAYEKYKVDASKISQLPHKERFEGRQKSSIYFRYDVVFRFFLSSSIILSLCNQWRGCILLVAGRCCTIHPRILRYL